MVEQRRRFASPQAPTEIFSLIFGRTELIIDASRAKSCEEFAIDVRFSVDPPKLHQKGVKRFSSPKNLAEKNFLSVGLFGLGDRFTPFWAGFGGSMEKRTSPSTSSQFFALDASIMSSVRPKIVGNVSVGALGSEMYRSNPPCPQPHQCGQGILFLAQHLDPGKLFEGQFEAKFLRSTQARRANLRLNFPRRPGKKTRFW